MRKTIAFYTQITEVVFIEVLFKPKKGEKNLVNMKKFLNYYLKNFSRSFLIEEYFDI